MIKKREKKTNIIFEAGTREVWYFWLEGWLKDDWSVIKVVTDMPTNPKLHVVNVFLLLQDSSIPGLNVGYLQNYEYTFLQVQVWGLEPISADTGWEAKTQKRITTVVTCGHFHLHVFGLWEEVGAPRENPRKHRENKQLHKERPAWNGMDQEMWQKAA